MSVTLRSVPVLTMDMQIHRSRTTRTVIPPLSVISNLLLEENLLDAFQAIIIGDRLAAFGAQAVIGNGVPCVCSFWFAGSLFITARSEKEQASEQETHYEEYAYHNAANLSPGEWLRLFRARTRGRSGLGRRWDGASVGKHRAHASEGPGCIENPSITDAKRTFCAFNRESDFVITIIQTIISILTEGVF
jgi:hypothetical protein